MKIAIVKVFGSSKARVYFAFSRSFDRAVYSLMVQSIDLHKIIITLRRNKVETNKLTIANISLSVL